MNMRDVRVSHWAGTGWRPMAARPSFRSACLLACTLTACGAKTQALVAGEAGQTAALTAGDTLECEVNPERNAYFGDLHVHTSYSFDAYAWDTRNDPEAAYKFARGEPMAIPPLDDEGKGTVTIQLDRPLDFAAVTDHSEFLGEVDLCVTEGSESYDTAACRLYRRGGPVSVVDMSSRIMSPYPTRNKAICGRDDSTCLQAAAGPWLRIQQAAEAANDECSFTSFVAYEYSGIPLGANMHRNVIFRTAQVPDLPVSYMEEPSPEGLWEQLDALCTHAGNGCEVLAIPHNSNLSQGRLFDVEYGGVGDPAEQAKIAARRARLEPIMEIFQHKGASECAFPAFTTDEECNFELLSTGESDENAFGKPPQESDFLRGALGIGLTESLRLGVNPFRLGVIGSTDTHNASPSYVDEDDWHGHVGVEDSDVPNSQIRFSPGGLVGVWAEENTRDALFKAMQRRETFGTSGPRMQVRFFGGWDYDSGLCADPNMLAQAYETGVAMGADLPAPNAGARAPRFLLQAMQDKVPLQVAQIIKIWVDRDGTVREQVFDVSGNRDNGADVDINTCERSGSGEAHLCAVWQDASFDPGQPAVYYARVLENPSCRWITHACNALPAGDRPAQCSDPNEAKIIKERAWTSPIWYQP
ncbi:MAG: DUF3604 domain-containing protein [Proteobacteria bacterium]|nr:DUF3604 domain-containing protein [Pseudomonadota bacterium]